ncbi:MAG: hypothetical protein IPK13_23625 [Deltaproteobacteria bacterium]|nr:hypothetical protein [Deltaproteobacteria bacterium]
MGRRCRDPTLASLGDNGDRDRLPVTVAVLGWQAPGASGPRRFPKIAPEANPGGCPGAQPARAAAPDANGQLARLKALPNGFGLFVRLREADEVPQPVEKDFGERMRSLEMHAVVGPQ